MDVVFGQFSIDEKEDAINNGDLSGWTWLNQQNDRFTNAHTIKGNKEIEGFSKKDAIATVERLASEDTPYDAYTEWIGYWDRDNEKIWVLSPVKMALLLHKYAEAEALMDKGYIFETEDINDIVYMPRTFNKDDYFLWNRHLLSEYDMNVSFSGGNISIWDVSVRVYGKLFIVADDELPMLLLNRLLNNLVEQQSLGFCDQDIARNPLKEKINPKWLIAIYERTGNEDYLEELRGYAFNGSPKFVVDSSAVSNLSKFTWSAHMYYYKFKFQLQLDIAKLLLEKGQYENMKNDIWRNNALGIEHGKGDYYMVCNQCNKKYTIEQITCITKQRKKMIDLCKGNKKLQQLVCLETLLEIASLQVELIDSNYDYVLEKDEKYQDIQRAIEQCKAMVIPYISKEWTDREIQTIIQKLFKDVHSLIGMNLIAYINECRDKKLELATNDEIVGTFGKWIIWLKYYDERYRYSMDLFKNSGNGGEAMDEKIDVHTNIEKYSKYLLGINWNVRGSWLNKRNDEIRKKVYGYIGEVDNEKLYMLLRKTGFLIDSEINTLIEKLIDEDRCQNVPLLIAIKG